MPEFKSEEERIAHLLKNACSRVHFSPAFKSKLLSQLIREGEAISVKRPRKLWARPLVWAPAAAAVLALVIIYVAIGLPGQYPSPIIVSPPPATEPVTPPQPSTPPLIASTGFLKMFVTDAPPQRNVTEINVMLSNVEVSKYVEGEDDGTWITVVTEEKEFDLIELKDANLKEFLGEEELATGLYLQIRMEVEIINVKIDGEETDVEVVLPGGKLRMVSSFEIREGEATEVTIDFDADKSLVFTGTDKVIFKPVVTLIIAYE